MCFTDNFVHWDCGILPVNIGLTVPSFGSYSLVRCCPAIYHLISFFRSKFSRNL